MSINSQGSSVKLMCGGHGIAKMYCENNVIYSSGNTVIYYVDTGVTYQEEVDEGETCLSPGSFIPVKDGWEFVGWRQDSDASADVLDSMVMGDNPVTLYAVFAQSITLSYNGNGASSGSTAAQTGTRYYNNSVVSNPTFTLRANGFAKSGYTFSKWAMGSASGTQYAAGASVTLSANTVFYAIYIATSLTVTGNSNYITTSGSLRAGVWYQSGRDQNTGYVHISYGAYKKVTIVFEISISNVWDEEEGRLTIAGVSVVDTRNDKRPSTYTYTGSAATIPLVFLVDNNDEGIGWSEIAVTIKSVVLSM